VFLVSGLCKDKGNVHDVNYTMYLMRPLLSVDDALEF
jgi:hypothetical protein